VTAPELAHLSEDQRELLSSTRELAKAKLLPIAEQGAEGELNRPLVEALATHGLLGRLFGEGSVSAMDLCLIREALACECTEAETAFALQGLGFYPLLLAGSSELVATWLPEVAAGRAVAAFALTEPEAGSDVGALQCAAERADGGWRLSGTKAYISNAPEADVYSIFARTGGPGPKGITAFALPGESDGLSGEPIELLSPHPIGRLELDGVFLGDDQVLGEVDGGFGVAMRTLNLFRPSVGAFAVGMAQAALEAATAHSAERHAFGRPLRELQAVSHRLAEMATRTQASRLLVHDAAAATDAETEGVARLVAMAKLYATEAAQYVVDGAVQILGARGLERGGLLEHLYREVRAPRIYEGTSEIQREIIARELHRAG
jgi:hypothetical protein